MTACTRTAVPILRAAAAVALLLTGVQAEAQAIYRPAAPPVATAAAEAWYSFGEPVVFAGDVYHRAGAAVFFDGHVMVPTGQYRGVPLYVDATREPFGVVYVPIGRGQLQPYERRRRGVLAGTVGSRLPSFPIALRPDAGDRGLPLLPTLAVFLGTSAAPAASARDVVPATVETTPTVAVPPPSGIATIQRPSTNDGVWITLDGSRWVSSGPAVIRTADMEAERLDRGRLVYRSRLSGPDTVYVPTRDGVVAPFRRKI